jgi:hypothetical protein
MLVCLCREADEHLPLLTEANHDIMTSVTERNHEQTGGSRPGHAGPPSS